MSLAQVMREVMRETPFLPGPAGAVTVEQLAEGEHEEALAFLAENPVHTVCLAGLIRDNGLVSEHNRGAHRPPNSVGGAHAARHAGVRARRPVLHTHAHVYGRTRKSGGLLERVRRRGAGAAPRLPRTALRAA